MIGNKNSQQNIKPCNCQPHNIDDRKFTMMVHHGENNIPTCKHQNRPLKQNQHISRETIVELHKQRRPRE